MTSLMGVSRLIVRSFVAQRRRVQHKPPGILQPPIAFRRKGRV
jgi:hypothetical protein